ncbi:hypothetical protein KY284_019446 [Solanum tuberosum]|nr:hypothetical protein KY284_019446 [Solanum tuberosum]
MTHSTEMTPTDDQSPLIPQINNDKVYLMVLTRSLTTSCRVWANTIRVGFMGEGVGVRGGWWEGEGDRCVGEVSRGV